MGIEKLPGVKSRNRSPASTVTELLDPKLTMPRFLIRRFIPRAPGWPPLSPKGGNARRSESMETVTGRKNSTCTEVSVDDIILPAEHAL